MLGAQLLFTRNESEYLDYIKMWLTGVLTKSRISKSNHLKNYPLQTETFYTEYMKLHDFQVHPRNFFRTDFRYEVHDDVKQGCRPYIYACCVDAVLAVKAKLKTCPPLTGRLKKNEIERCLGQISKKSRVCKSWCSRTTCEKTKCKGCNVCNPCRGVWCGVPGRRHKSNSTLVCLRSCPRAEGLVQKGSTSCIPYNCTAG